MYAHSIRTKKTCPKRNENNNMIVMEKSREEEAVFLPHPCTPDTLWRIFSLSARAFSPFLVKGENSLPL